MAKLKMNTYKTKTINKKKRIQARKPKHKKKIKTKLLKKDKKTKNVKKQEKNHYAQEKSKCRDTTCLIFLDYK